MTRLERPLVFRILRSTGDVALRSELRLALETNRGSWKQATFLVDPGTEMTTMLAGRAREFDLPIPKKPVPRLTLHGQEVRAALLRARMVGMDLTEYIFPCDFIGDPGVPPPTTAKNLLGLSSVINQVRLTFDGTISAWAPYGVLVVEKI
jgi:hypothetical protein